MADTQATTEAVMKQMFGDSYQPASAPASTDAPAAAATTESATIETPQGVTTEPAAVTTEPAVATTTEPKTETPPPVAAELTEEQIIAFLKKNKGIDVKSLEDFVPKVDPVVEAEQKENKKIAYAFEKGLISRREYDAYVSDKANPQNVVYENYAADAKADDPDLTDEQIAESFAEEFSLSADPNSFKYKQGQKRLGIIAGKLMSDKHGKVLSIDSEFSNYETSIKQKEERLNKILSETPKYKSEVEAALTNHSKVKISLGENDEYEVALTENDYKTIKEAFLSKEQAEQMIGSGYSKEQLDMSIKMAIREANFDKIVKQITDQKLAKYAKGTQGIPVLDGLKDVKVDVKKLTDKEIAYAKHIGLPVSEN